MRLKRIFGLVDQWLTWDIADWKLYSGEQFKDYEQYRDWYEKISFIYWDIMSKGGKMAFKYHAFLFYMCNVPSVYYNRKRKARIMCENVLPTMKYYTVYGKRFESPEDLSIFPKSFDNTWTLNLQGRIPLNGAFVVHCKDPLYALDKEMGLIKGFSAFMSDRIGYKVVTYLKKNNTFPVRLFCVYFKPKIA